MGLLEVDRVQYLDLILIPLEQFSTFNHNTAFWIGDNVGTVKLHEVWLNEKPRLAAAGAAHHQHVFIPGILGVRRTVGHHQPFRFGQDNVVGKLGSHERLNVLGRTP